MELGKALARRRVIRRAAVSRHLVRAAVFSRRGLSDNRISRLRQSLLAAATDQDLEQLVSVAREVGPQIAAGAYPAARWLLERHQASGACGRATAVNPDRRLREVAASAG